MNGGNASVADAKMRQVSKSFRKTGLMTGALSGLTYGIYTTLVMVAGYYEPLAGAAGFLAAPYVCAGLNDLFAGLWLLIYNAKMGRLAEIGRTLNTFFAWIFLKQRPTKRVVAGMVICVAGAIVINWAKPEGAPNFTLGILCSLLAAICWGLEGTLSSYGGAMVDTDVATNIRELFSGLVNLVVIVPLVGGLGLLGGTMAAGMPIVWLVISGLSAGASYLLWYQSNATVGCAIGMSLNVTYAFWGVLFCVLFLGQAVTPTIVIGSIVIIAGAILVTMNPLDFFKKEEH